MRAIFETYSSFESIPLRDYLKHKKLGKYFNRETAAAIVALGKLLKGEQLPPETPFYYDTGLLRFEDYGLREVVAASRGADGFFSQKCFVEKGLSAISPLNQFKVLQNMPLSFLAIEYQLKGDNAVFYSSPAALLASALHSNWPGPLLVGAGQVNADGEVQTGFVLGTAGEIERLPWQRAAGDTIAVFRSLHAEGEAL